MRKYTNAFVKLFLAAFAVIILASCGASRDEIVYFSNADASITEKAATNDYSPELMPDDLLEISVQALDFDAVIPFIGEDNVGTTENSRSRTYLIDQNGNINFPVIGLIEMAGLTRLQATDLLTEKISVYIKNPTVNIKILNFKITVLGEVKLPGTFQIENERITILEALGLAQDMTIFGKRDNVLVVREIDGKKTYTRVDLTTEEVFTSDVYYLTQNDVVYVEPNGDRLNQSKSNFSQRTLPIIGVILSAGTLAVLILREY